MQWALVQQWSWKYMMVPSIIGFFFGLGNFFIYLLFRYEGFAKAEAKLNHFLS